MFDNRIKSGEPGILCKFDMRKLTIKRIEIFCFILWVDVVLGECGVVGSNIAF